MSRQLRLAALAMVFLLAVAGPALGAPAARGPGAAGAHAIGGFALAVDRTPHGAAVVVAGREATTAAKLLARRAYQEPSLRPALDEATAAALVGTGKRCESPPCDERLDEIYDVVDAVAAACSPSCQASPVARRLLTSLGRDLSVAWIVLVQAPAPEAGTVRPASVHLLRVATGRFEPMVLSAKPSEAPDAGMWDEVAPILRSVVAATATEDAAAARPPTAPRAATSEAKPKGPGGKAARPSPGASPAASGVAEGETDEGEVRVLSSPWFWGGLGVLVAAGITVFAVSQSSLSEPDTVRLEGRVAP
jgi:hypothetical protein